MTMVHFPTDIFRERRTHGEVINEAYCLIGRIIPGECVSDAAYDRGELHLSSLDLEFAELNASQMAHKLAERLQLKPRMGFWGRLQYAFSGRSK